MIRNILYAKRLILPSRRANVIQSLQMAAAFSATGLPTHFFPGMKNARSEAVTSPAEALDRLLPGLGIDSHPPEWRALRGGHKGMYSLHFRLNVGRVLRSTPQVLIYARDAGDAAFLAALRRTFLFRRPDSLFLYEMHEALFRQHRDIEGRADWQRTMERERRILAAVDGLVVTNRDIADIARAELAFTGPVLEAPNAVNDSVFRPVELFSESAPWPGKDGDVRLVYIGNMQPGKGVRELVRAMGLLPPRFCLKIIGAGGEKELSELRGRIVFQGLDPERISLTGHVPQGDIYKHCRGAHISILPQQERGGYFSPLKLNESLALGLPVVCTPLPVFDRQAGLLQRSRDCTAEGLAEAVRQLADNPEEARRLREKGLQAVAGCTWKARAVRILDFAGDLRRLV